MSIPTNLLPERIQAASCHARESRILTSRSSIRARSFRPTANGPFDLARVKRNCRARRERLRRRLVLRLHRWTSGGSSRTPFRRVRIYYSATLPAVSQTPRIAGILLYGSPSGSVAAAIGDIICEMCGLVIEKGRLASAAVAGVGAADVAFDASTGCFFARTTGWSGRTLDIAKMARDGRSGSTEFAKTLRGKNTIATETYEPSDA